MKKNISFWTSTILILSLVINLNAQSDTTTIIILHTNDMHSNIDKYPKIAYLVNQYEQKYENVFLFSAGDLFTGNPIVDKYKDPGFPMVDLMNRIGYDISCIGNHEFDLGQERLNKRIAQADFPFISLNINSENAIFNQPNAYKKLSTKSGITIGVLGLIQLEANGYPATNRLKLGDIIFYDPFVQVKKYTTYEDSSDVFILLTHLGIKGDEQIANENTCFDVIIGGHSHTYLQGGKTVNNTFIVQAGSKLRAIGVLTIKMYDGKIVSKIDTLIDTKSIKNTDKEIKKVVDSYNNNPFFNEVIGITKNDISGSDELGAMMTDAMRDVLNCDIAFQNIGGIRVDEFKKGNITKKMIYQLSPFGNVFIVYKLRINQIKKLIKYAYYLENSNELQVSGMNIQLKINKKGKLKKISLFDVDGNKLENKEYSVAINDYMASAYVLDFLKEDGEKKNVIDADATMEYLKKTSPVDYTGVKRVEIIQK
ncbi:MAG: bifunctional UDP-sugar hydrolase/5'-nucleotidase [Bacteroidota bacterium]|nr:bifunctional UDP-sugar hydrolase/5'-nucleotidase [Bacteroidota bacterium]